MSMANLQLRRKMLANRKAAERTCGSCGRPLDLGEEIYACSECDGYHHCACWDAAPVCGSPSFVGTVSSADASPGRETASVPRPVPVASAGAVDVATVLQADGVLAEDERSCPSCRKVIKRE